MSDAPLVLCADDDEDILSLVALRLERAGFEVVHGGDGERRCAVARERKPDPRRARRDDAEARRATRCCAALRADAALASVKVDPALGARVQEADVERGSTPAPTPTSRSRSRPRDLARRSQSCSRGCWPSPAVAVAEPAHRLDRRCVRCVRHELSPQIADVELHLVARDAVGVAPDELEQLVA